jgi:hypothetical protein
MNAMEEALVHPAHSLPEAWLTAKEGRTRKMV